MESERQGKRGRPEAISQNTYERAIELRKVGLTLHATAEKLSKEGYPRGDGSTAWTFTNVARLIERRERRQRHTAVSSDERPG